MFTPRDKRNIVLFVMGIILIALLFIYFQKPASEKKTGIEYKELSKKIDSVPAKIQPPPISASGEARTVIKFVERTGMADRKKVLDGLRIIDSLKNELKQSVKLQQYSAILDTIIHSTKDTIRAEYDFIKNTFHLNYNLSPREIKVARETIIVEKTNNWGFGFCAGYGAGLAEGAIKPTPFIGIGIYKSIWN